MCPLLADVNVKQRKPRDFRDHVMANDVIAAAMLVCSNLTSVDSNSTTGSCEQALMTSADGAGAHRLLSLVTATVYSIICGVGAVGNTVVVAVVLLDCVMRSSVTNIYIVNLAVADFCFLAGLPLLIVTVLRQVREFDKIFLYTVSKKWTTSSWR